MDIKYKEITTINEFIDAVRLRHDVFVNEQGFKPGWEPDEDDKKSKHFIAIVDNKIVATVRYRQPNKDEIKIERMATMKQYRKKGIARGLIEFTLTNIKKQKPKRIFAACQVHSQQFWEKCSFKPVSKPYDLWGVQHIDMEYSE